MSDVIDTIRRDVGDDNTINASEVYYEVRKNGLFSRRKSIHITGSVNSDIEKGKITQIAEHHAGDRFDVINGLSLKEKV